MTTKEKIIKYLKDKGISQDKFSRKCNLSSGFLRTGKHIGSEKLKIIRDNYPDLNMNWLLYDEGNMLLDSTNMVNEPQENYTKTEDCNHLRELLKAKEETIAILKHQLGIKEDNSKAS